VQKFSPVPQLRCNLGVLTLVVSLWKLRFFRHDAGEPGWQGDCSISVREQCVRPNFPFMTFRSYPAAISRNLLRLFSAALVLLLSANLAAQITVSLQPSSACLVLSQKQQFQATVTGATDTSVTWAVDNVKGGYSSGGFINSSGLYTAPATAATHYVQAISNADATTTGVAQVTVRSGAAVSVLPVSASIMTESAQQFSAVACGLSSPDVIWSVDGVTGGTTSTGTIDTNGNYVAPAAAGTHTVKATSASDSSKNASAAVTVYSQITADFASRNSTTYPVPAGTFGTQLGFLFNGFYSNQQGMQYLTDAGLTSMRVDALLHTTYSTTTPNWSQLDDVLTNLRNHGVQPLVVMGYTPPWLQPSPNSCANYNAQLYHAVPTDINQWAALTAAFVAHVDQKFPGYVRDYEIWNEPDNSPGLCVPDNQDSSRLSAYLQMYAAAAPLMKAQAAADGITIRIGGPALTNSGTANEWIPALTTNAGTAPYVDFISYHQYATSPLVEQSGSTWDNAGAPESLAFRTQDPGSGFTAIYRNIVNLTKKGSQPNAASTPVMLDEYNTTASFTPDCCRNDFVYSPLFNALVMQDTLNTVFSGVSTVPARVLYFAAQNWYPDKKGTVWFCLVGTIDPLMDCAYSASTAQPYPQYYAYNLLLGSNYLGLGSGGFLAASTPKINQAGVAVSAFYTAANDALVITNPTASDLNNVSISLQNTGNLPVATLYLLNSANPTISGQTLQVTRSGNGYTATISVPHYSVVGISLSATGPTGILVGVSPVSAAVRQKQTQQFTATVSGATDNSVTWSVDGVAGGNSTVGTVSASGLFTAPAASGNHTVTATSVQDPTRSASAQVTVTSPVAVSITPTSATIPVGQSQQFQATVTNSSDTTVTWSVDGIAGGNAQVGTITASGVYTAPSSTSSHTVAATSNADSSATATAQVTTTAALAISPAAVSVHAGTTQKFQAMMNGSSANVTWAVDGTPGGMASVGTISATGVYSAPSTTGQHTVTATLQSSSQTASAQVSVLPPADFSLALAPPNATINAGSSARFVLTIAPAGYAGPVTVRCSGAPQGSTCALSPSSITLDGTNAASATITLTTTARTVAMAAPLSTRLTWTLATFLFPLVLLTAGAGRRKIRAAAVVVGLAVILSLTACGGGGGSSGGPGPPPVVAGTPAGTYTVTVGASAGTTTHTALITLKVN